MRTFRDTKDWYIITLVLRRYRHNKEAIVGFYMAHEKNVIFNSDDGLDSNQYTYLPPSTDTGKYRDGGGLNVLLVPYNAIEYYVEQSDCVNRCRELLLQILTGPNPVLDLRRLRNEIRATCTRK